MIGLRRSSRPWATTVRSSSAIWAKAPSSRSRVAKTRCGTKAACNTRRPFAKHYRKPGTIAGLPPFLHNEITKYVTVANWVGRGEEMTVVIDEARMQRASFLNDPKVRSRIVQIVFVLLLAWFCYEI